MSDAKWDIWEEDELLLFIRRISDCDGARCAVVVEECCAREKKDEEVKEEELFAPADVETVE